MPIHDKAFYCILFFLSGILLASIIQDSPQRIFISFLTAAILAAIFLLIRCFKTYLVFLWLALFSFSLFLGSAYYFIYDVKQREITMPFDAKIELQALVSTVSDGFDGETLVLSLLSPYSGKVEAFVPRYPRFSYGDILSVSGLIKKPNEKARHSLEKDGIFGVMSFPKIELVSSGNGLLIKSALLKIKDFAIHSFQKALGSEEAAFMSGLTLGDTAEFEKDFKDKMRVTGTTHIVALSGYNITIIASAVISLFGFFYVPRRSRFLGSVFAIFAFVLMTGATASVVRAGIMGFIGLLAREVQRAYSVRNAIVVSAFLMVLINPKILVWDIGFELSFLALLGLIYLRPAIARLFGFRKDSGFFGWRENFLTTLSAQLAVLPLVLLRFGSFSVLSLLTNVLLLWAIPITMSFGFGIVAVSLLSGLAARFLGFFAHIFVWYEMAVINFFSRFQKLSLSVEHVAFWFVIVYYLILILFVILDKKERLKKAYA